jgi:hypothetical protein
MIGFTQNHKCFVVFCWRYIKNFRNHHKTDKTNFMFPKAIIILFYNTNTFEKKVQSPISNTLYEMSSPFYEYSNFLNLNKFNFTLSTSYLFDRIAKCIQCPYDSIELSLVSHHTLHHKNFHYFISKQEWPQLYKLHFHSVDDNNKTMMMMINCIHYMYI